ncbi:MAG TPA: hypothetical protein PK771_04280 [Spirochaetota bacterium]|nr:hypothetical protein [Spirochaetota bacterium]
MKKFLALCLFIAIFVFSVSAQSFNESVAGSLKVSGQKVGVLWVDPQSYVYPLMMSSKTVNPPDNYFTIGIKAQLIKKGASVMVLNPPGMEKIMSPFIDIRGGQFHGKEMIANNLVDVAKISLGMNGKGVFTYSSTSESNPEGIKLVRELMSSTEFTGEIDRINQFSEFYNKIISLWGVSKLITIESPNKYYYIIRGYELDGASSGLVFQYYMKTTDKDMFKKISTGSVIGGADLKEDDFTIIDEGKAKEKPEDSDKVIYAVIKKVGSYFK